MTSRVLSRFLPVAEGDVSVYDGRRRDAARRADVEAQRHRTYTDGFQDDDDDNPDAFLYDAALDDATPTDPGQSPEMGSPLATHAKRYRQSPSAKRRSEEDEDVPESLLLDPKSNAGLNRQQPKVLAETKLARAEAQWKFSQEQGGLHASRAPRSSRPPSRPSRAVPTSTTQGARPSPQADATWLYTNATNLDAFLLEVYQYFVGHGVWSILLARVITLLTELFAFSFTMFLSTCIDYSKIPTSKSTAEVMIPKCMAQASWIKKAALFFFVIWFLLKAINYTRDVRRLFQMRNFYHHVLGISDQDIQTVSWVRVVEGLIKVQNANVATANPSDQGRKYLEYKQPRQRLNAESIANRLMRRDNYYVAMYNKELLDFNLPVPLLGTRHFYSKSLEWSIDFCLTNFIFDETGSIRPFCLEVKNRSALVGALRTRLRAAALFSILIAPVTITYNLLMYVLKYYTEFTKNPSRASARGFAPYAEWKIREFNELHHLFERRLRQAAPFATEYLKQFPKDKTDQICRFVAFVSGAIAAALTIATLFDPELFLGFEVTPGRTAVFWLSVTVGIFGVANGSLPDDNDVHNPVLHLKEVLMFTHYLPAHWKDRLHSEEVRAEFAAMFKLKILIFAEEVLSLFVTPLILWQNSGKTCERIVDFFREQTVHIEGIGYQCNFAYFNFKKDPNAEDPTALLEHDGLRDDYYNLKDDKMAASVQNFMQYYSHYNHRQGARRPQGWQPPPAWPPGVPGIAEEGESTYRSRPSQNMKRSGNMDARQTTGSAIRSPRQGANRARRRAMDQVPEEAGYRAVNTHKEPPVTESRLMAQDSDLQDFADAPGDVGLESDTDVDDEVKEAGGYAGVLGMAAQFAKAQTGKGHGPANL